MVLHLLILVVQGRRGETIQIFSSPRPANPLDGTNRWMRTLNGRLQRLKSHKKSLRQRATQALTSFPHHWTFPAVWGQDAWNSVRFLEVKWVISRHPVKNLQAKAQETKIEREEARQWAHFYSHEKPCELYALHPPHSKECADDFNGVAS
jgi:hypothetical protein